MPDQFPERVCDERDEALADVAKLKAALESERSAHEETKRNSIDMREVRDIPPIAMRLHATPEAVRAHWLREFAGRAMHAALSPDVAMEAKWCVGWAASLLAAIEAHEAHEAKQSAARAGGAPSNDGPTQQRPQPAEAAPTSHSSSEGSEPSRQVAAADTPWHTAHTRETWEAAVRYCEWAACSAPGNARAVFEAFKAALAAERAQNGGAK